MTATTNTLNSITTTFERDGETATRTQWFPINGYVLTVTDFGTWKKWNVSSPQGLPEVVEEARYELDAAPTSALTGRRSARSTRRRPAPSPRRSPPPPTLPSS